MVDVLSYIETPYIFGASVIGPLHLLKGLPCQDACAYEVISSDYGVIAVSDGLGSASKSDIGSQIAVNSAVEKIKEIILKKGTDTADFTGVLKKAIQSARRKLKSKANEKGCQLRELACTLIIVIFYRDAISIAHIGDGAVVVKNDKGLEIASAPGDAEYVNEVVPLTDKEWKKFLRITSPINNVECVAVFTDGCQRASLLKTAAGLQPYNRFFEPLFSYANELVDIGQGEEDIKELLNSEKLKENSEDDKTLVIAVLKKGGECNDE